jgi:hypothetical protein
VETAVYSDFELRKGKAKKKREAGIVGPEQSKEAGAATVAAAEQSATAGGEAVKERAELAVVEERAGEERGRRLPDEEIRELMVERIVPNPRLVLASYEARGVKQLVKVWVGVNRNFRPRMTLKAQRGATEYAPWKLVGRRPRLPGRW